jgi:hypothetical protein
LRLLPDVFWTLTLGEWSCLLDGYYEEIEQHRRESAWSLSHLLAAAGCDPDAVTPARLLGEPEPRIKRSLDTGARKQRDLKQMFRRMERKRHREVQNAE